MVGYDHHWSLIIDHWSLIIDNWLVIVDCWLLIVDCWWLLIMIIISKSRLQYHYWWLTKVTKPGSNLALVSGRKSCWDAFFTFDRCCRSSFFRSWENHGISCHQTFTFLCWGPFGERGDSRWFKMIPGVEIHSFHGHIPTSSVSKNGRIPQKGVPTKGHSEAALTSASRWDIAVAVATCLVREDFHGGFPTSHGG